MGCRMYLDWICRTDGKILTVNCPHDTMDITYDLADENTRLEDVIEIEGYHCVKSSKRLSERNTPRIRAIKLPGDSAWIEI